MEILASLPLGKDVFFVVRCGPDVLAITSDPGGARLMGRWSYDRWIGAGGVHDEREDAGGPHGA